MLHIALAGHFASGDGMAERLLQITESQPNEFPKENLLAFLNELLMTVHDEKAPFEVRLLDEDGRVRSVQTKPK